MKQNSIEWLYDQMSNIAAGYATELNQQEILEKAKAMHKEEIEVAYESSHLECNKDKFGFEYYNDTFNK